MNFNSKPNLSPGGLSGRQIQTASDLAHDRRFGAMSESFLDECWEIADPAGLGRQRDDGTTNASDALCHPDAPAASQTRRDDESAGRGPQLPNSALSPQGCPETEAGAVVMASSPDSTESESGAYENWTDDDRRQAYNERAAIMEFDGRLSRETAEAEARRITGYFGDK